MSRKFLADLVGKLLNAVLREEVGMDVGFDRTGLCHDFGLVLSICSDRWSTTSLHGSHGGSW